MKRFCIYPLILAGALMATGAGADEAAVELPDPEATCTKVTEAIVTGNSLGLIAAMTGGATATRSENAGQMVRLQLQAVSTIAFTQGLLRGQPAAQVETASVPVTEHFVTQISRASTAEGQEAYVVCAAGLSGSGRLFHHHSGVQPTREAALENLERYLNLVQATEVSATVPDETPI